MLKLNKKQIMLLPGGAVRPKDRRFNSNYKGYILGYPPKHESSKNQVLSQNPNKQSIVFRVSQETVSHPWVIF
jgi:hypothetical protein